MVPSAALWQLFMWPVASQPLDLRGNLVAATNVTHPPGSYFPFDLYVLQGCKIRKGAQRPFRASISEYCCSATFAILELPSESPSALVVILRSDSSRISTYTAVSRMALYYCLFPMSKFRVLSSLDRAMAPCGSAFALEHLNPYSNLSEPLSHLHCP